MGRADIRLLRALVSKVLMPLSLPTTSQSSVPRLRSSDCPPWPSALKGHLGNGHHHCWSLMSCHVPSEHYQLLAGLLPWDLISTGWCLHPCTLQDVLVLELMVFVSDCCTLKSVAVAPDPISQSFEQQRGKMCCLLIMQNHLE